MKIQEKIDKHLNELGGNPKPASNPVFPFLAFLEDNLETKNFNDDTKAGYKQAIADLKKKFIPTTQLYAYNAHRGK